MKTLQFSASQLGLIAAPPALLLTTYLTFRLSAVRLGTARGYLIGFLFYWIGWCLLLTLLTVGADGLRQMFGVPTPQFGQPNWLGIILLAGPPLLMFATQFPEKVRGAGLLVFICSAAYAVANGMMEEMLWRGAYVTAFPNSWLWAYIYPSIWFGLWHISPQAVESGTVTSGTVAFALMSITLGLVWGWVAKTTGSIRWTVVAHILLNFAGFAGRWFVP
jgi:membrane protease YdiL (CAAX protease family)